VHGLTLPPAFRMRSFSAGSTGVWSVESRSSAGPSTSLFCTIEARESPTFAQTTLRPWSKTRIPVLPLNQLLIDLKPTSRWLISKQMFSRASTYCSSEYSRCGLK
jgi:hypothetical protein